MAHIMSDSAARVSVPDVPTGWECPRCQCIYAPKVEQCIPCSPLGPFRVRLVTGPPDGQARD